MGCEAMHFNASEQIKDLQDAFAEIKQDVLAPLDLPPDGIEAHGACSSVHLPQEAWQRRFEDFQGRQRQQLKSWHATGQDGTARWDRTGRQEAAEALTELKAMEVRMPDLVAAGVLLEEASCELLPEPVINDIKGISRHFKASS